MSEAQQQPDRCAHSVEQQKAAGGQNNCRACEVVEREAMSDKCAELEDEVKRLRKVLESVRDSFTYPGGKLPDIFVLVQHINAALKEGE